MIAVSPIAVSALEESEVTESGVWVLFKGERASTKEKKEKEKQHTDRGEGCFPHSNFPISPIFPKYMYFPFPNKYASPPILLHYPSFFL